MAIKSLPHSTNEFYVYIIFRPNGIPCYIGKGKGNRFRKTAKETKNPHLNNLFKKHSGNLPVVKFRGNLLEEEAFMLEKLLISILGREDIETGILFNLTDGGEGQSGSKHSDESKSKIGASSKRNWADPEYNTKMKSRPIYIHTEETKAKIKDSNIRTKSNPEYRMKCSQRAKAAQTPEVIFNRTQKQRITKSTPEWKLKASDTAKRRMTPELKKKISEANKTTKNTREYKILQSKLSKTFHSDPVIKEKHRQAVIQSWKRRKESVLHRD